MNVEEKFSSFQDYLLRLRQKKVLERYYKARSLKEYVILKCETIAIEHLMDKGIIGGEITTYTTFIRKVLSEICIFGVKYMDKIIDLYEHIWIDKQKANPEYIKLCEEVIVSAMNNWLNLEREYNRMVKDRQVYEEIMKKKKSEVS
jgi:hypothetical protein